MICNTFKYNVSLIDGIEKAPTICVPEKGGICGARGASFAPKWGSNSK